MSESLHRVAQTSQGASALSPALAEVAPQVRPLGFTARLVRNPEWFTVGLIIVTCLVVGTMNPRFFQFATLFDLLHARMRRGRQVARRTRAARQSSLAGGR